MSDEVKDPQSGAATTPAPVDTQAYKGKTVRFKCPNCDHIFLPSAKERQTRTGRSSRAKGANFERLVAKKLQKWWNGDTGKYEFRRTPQSGGSALKLGFDMAGDIATNAPDFRYHIECKNAPTYFAGLHQFLTAPNGHLLKWWGQAKADCPTHRIPLLVINRSDQPTYCLAAEGDIIMVLERLGLRYLSVPGQRCVWLLDSMLATNPESWK